MRFVYWFITALVAVVVVVFAVSNRAVVALALFPLPVEIQAPLYLVVFAAAVLGFIVGALVAWLSAGKHRRESRHLRRRIDRLQRDMSKSLPVPVKEP